jgi:uncharacterized HAD superfamily protein
MLRMHRARICLDFDGTIAKTHDLTCHLFNWRFGTQVKPEDIDRFDFWEDRGLGKEFWAIWDLMDSARLRLAAPPYDGHLAAVLQVWDMQKKNVNLVTCNEESARLTILDWLQLHIFRGEPCHPMKIFCLGRFGGRRKLELAYDIYIDDHPVLAVEIVRHPGKMLYLADAPYNRDVPDGPQVRRFSSWRQVEDWVG